MQITVRIKLHYGTKICVQNDQRINFCSEIKKKRRMVACWERMEDAAQVGGSGAEGSRRTALVTSVQ